ncbi:MAG: Holliday junction branch migration protein RuvA [Clostridia bacterium]|nr:Holliday junction branch migration protein RuvA [Clostridia bacterium]
MFAYLKGVFDSRTMDYIVIDVNGIGYKIFMSENSMKEIGEIGSIVKVHTYVKVREDDISIYGFSSGEELRMFELLISVSGIGAKSAITILSNIEPSTFAAAVVSDDVNILKKLPGVGAKSAQRIILELKDKLKSMNIDESGATSDTNIEIINNDNVEDLISALQVLGYSRKDIENIISKLDIKNESLEDLIKKALVLLSK